MKSIFKHFLLVFSLLSVQFSIAQTPTWKNITPAGWSGDFKQVFYGKGNGLIALADNGYFYLSKDTAHTWTIYLQPDTAIIAAVMYPDNTNGFLYNQVTAYKTADGAKTWTKLPMTGIPTDMQIRTIWIKNADTVFAVVTNLVNGVRIFLSSDKGNTWTQVAQNIIGLSVYTTLYEFYFPTPLIGYGYGYGCYVETNDGGKTWNGHTLIYVERDNVYTKTYSYPNGRTIIFYRDYNGTNNAIYSSSDGNPSTVTQVGTTSDWVTDVVAFGANVSAIDQSGYLYYSVDSGVTWNSKVILSNRSLESMYFLDKNNGIVVSNLLTSIVTTDGGTTWAKYVHGAADGLNKIYCKTRDECYITGNAGRLFHTIDGGTNWNYRDLQGGKLVEVEFPTKDTGYVSGGGVIFRTIDAGVNWTKFTQSTGGGFMYFPTQDTGFIGYSNGSSPDIAKTINAGQTWNNWLADMTFINNGGGGFAYFRSSTDGLVGGKAGKLLYTTDGGNSWQVKSMGFNVNTISTIQENWLLTSGGSIYLCDKNINCSLKYNDSTDNYSIPKKLNDSIIYMKALNDNVLISSNYGITWHKEHDSVIGSEFSFGNKNTIYTLNPYMGQNYQTINRISKGVFKANTNIKTFNRVDNRTLSFNIINDAEDSFNAIVKLIDNQDTVIINANITIGNNVPLLIKIPQTIQAGTGYKIRIVPLDTSMYSTVESQMFEITTGITEIEKTYPKIKVVGNTIVCDCEHYEIFNYLGEKISNTNLSIGLYIVKCNNITQKIVIKP